MIYVIESPFRATPQRTREEHRIHALKLCRAIALAGGVPFASHTYCPAFLDEDDAAERALGIEIQKQAIRVATAVLVWDDWGISTGMGMAIRFAGELGGIYGKLGPQIHYHSQGQVPEWDRLDEITLP